MRKDEKIRDLYRRLVREHGDRLYRFALRSCGDAHVAEDLVAETCAEAWRSLPGLRDPKAGRAWLFRILRRRCSRWYRERSDSRRCVDLEAAADVAAPGLDQLDALVLRQSLQEALDRIDPRFKEPLLMVFVEGLSCRETADALDLPLGTVLSRIHRARQGLRRIIDRQDELRSDRRGGDAGGRDDDDPPRLRRIEGKR